MAVADLLREAREHRGLTLEQLAHETKIPVERLTAFEDERLPPNGGFYHRAQIRAYAQALSLDERRVLQELDRDVIAATPVPPPDAPKPRLGRVPVTSTALTIACVLGVAAIGTAMRDREPSPARAAQPAVAAPLSPDVERARVVQDDPTSAEVAPASLATSGVVQPPPAPVETPAVPAAPTVTQLVIATKPEGARVTVDGIGWGVTPVTIRHLSEGRKRIRVTTDGYAAVERVIEVQPDRVNRVSIQLRSLP